jgi:hypothetical protein
MSKPKVIPSPADKQPSSESLKRVGGSRSDGFNNIVCNQVLSAIWPSSNPEQLTKQYEAALAAMMGIEPRDEIEGMLAAQMVATHSAAMECYRRAMLDNQTFEGRRENLNQANKLTRSYATLMEALNRHRGKGQQKVTVEHVHVHQGGQAIVGNVTPGGGVSSKLEDQPVAPALTHEPGQALPREIETVREAVPSAGG